MDEYNSLDIRYEVEDKLKDFIGDRSKLSIILGNIISNAIKYQDPARKNSFLEIKVTYLDKILKISFTDNGIGIHKNQVDNVFEMFHRCTEKSTGSGLGMFIVKQTVEKLNGVINLQSKLGKGTEININLPCSIDDEKRDGRLSNKDALKGLVSTLPS